MFCVRRYFRHPPCPSFSVASFSNDGHNRRTSNPYCNLQFICRYTVVIPNQDIKLVFNLRRRCRGWSAVVGSVTSNLFTTLKKTDPASNLPNIYGILTIHDSQTSVNIGMEPSVITPFLSLSLSLSLIRPQHPPFCTPTVNTWLTGTPVILVELDSVAIRWVRQQTLHGIS